MRRLLGSSDHRLQVLDHVLCRLATGRSNYESEDAWSYYTLHTASSSGLSSPRKRRGYTLGNQKFERKLVGKVTAIRNQSKAPND